MQWRIQDLKREGGGGDWGHCEIFKLTVLA